MKKTDCEMVQQAILLAYPEEPAEAAVRSHLAACPECRDFAAFQQKLMVLSPVLPHPAPTLAAVRERKARQSLRFWRSAFQVAAAAAVLLAAALPVFWFGASRETQPGSGPQAEIALVNHAVAPVPPTLAEMEELFTENDAMEWTEQELYAAAESVLAFNWDNSGTTGIMEQNLPMPGNHSGWQIDLTEAQQQLGKVVEL